VNHSKKHIAYLLLLLFIRVMLPEVALLQFHQHAHTDDGHAKSDTRFKLDKQHTHCHIDGLFNAGFVPASFPVIKPFALLFADTYSASFSCRWKVTFPSNTYLRGPPIR
jgi:hypothetical protein